MKPSIPRHAVDTALRLARGFPVLAITGPRQAGKTTLARDTFPDKPYVSLEDPDEREFASSDPRSFLARFPAGAVLDEAQRCPELFSWLQGVVDERLRDGGGMGQFVLTGSQQFGLLSGITQSLAGRVGLLQLLPFSMAELGAASRLPASLEQVLWRGGYPPLHDRSVAPSDWFPNYIATYLERDVRQIIAVRDLSLFQRFLRMCAARTGQILNLSSLAADCGISHVTAREWISVLEASYVLHLLRPFHQNFGKRLTKSPKLYFLDTGLCAALLGVRDAETLQTHAMRGALFETLIISDYLKRDFNAGVTPDMYFWRDSSGLEVDLLRSDANGMQAIEIKAGASFASDWTGPVRKWAQLAEASLPPWIIYGGKQSSEREACRVVAWRDLSQS